MFGLLEELLSGDGSVGERVDGVHLQVWFAVVLEFITFSVPPRADRFHYHFSTRDLILHVALQNTGGKIWEIKWSTSNIKMQKTHLISATSTLQTIFKKALKIIYIC